jgi:chromosome segregation ATPase
LHGAHADWNENRLRPLSSAGPGTEDPIEPPASVAAGSDTSLKELMMAGLIQNLLGNGSRDKEMLDQMRAMLEQMQQEHTRIQSLIESAHSSTTTLGQYSETIGNAQRELETTASRVREVEQRLDALTQLASRYETLDDRAEALKSDQQKAESQIADALRGANEVRTVFEELSQRVDEAISLKDRLGSFLEIEKPFQQLKGEADGVREQLHGAGEHVARLREQHERLMDTQKLAMSKMEALDLRREDLARSIIDKERRVALVEESVKSMDGVQHRVEEVLRDMGTLKALGDSVAQKSAAIESQRDAVERALALADRLTVAMRQVDAGVRQQQDNEQAMAAMQERVKHLNAMHESVLERSREITQLQRDTDGQMQATRQDLSMMRDEMKATVERFDFESKGLESTTQRVADLRGALTDFENRFRSLTESSQAIGVLKVDTQALASQFQSLQSGVGSLNEEFDHLQAMRREVDEIRQASGEASANAQRLRDAQPLLEAALHDYEKLNGAHAAVRDALEQTSLAHQEIGRMREAQGETRNWLASVDQSTNVLRGKVDELSKLAPMIDSMEKQAERIGQSVSAIESRRDFIDDMQQRMADLGALGSRLDERDRQLQARMDGADQRFEDLNVRAEEAERIAKSMGGVSAQVNEAENQTNQIRQTVREIEERCESVESLAERTNLMRQELDQRQHALEEASRDLRQASSMRQEAADTAQKLEGVAKRLAAELEEADQHVTAVDAASKQLEDRTATLQDVRKQLDEFEQRLAKWEMVEQDITRTMEQLTARQSTVDALQADLDRMFAMAEKTASHVKSITSTHREIDESRGLLREVLGRLNEIKNTASSLDERKRQMAKAEERLGRAEALLLGVRSGLEALQGQKAIVDQAVEKAGSLRFLLKQAEAMIDTLREEREVTARMSNAVAVVREADSDLGEDEEDSGTAMAA